MTSKELNGISIRESFAEFDRKNPQVYTVFKKQALKAIAAGKKKLSSKALIHYIVWDMFVKTEGSEPFRINNNYTAFYARKFCRELPMYNGIFEIRKLRSEDPGPYMNIDPDGQLSFF